MAIEKHVFPNGKDANYDFASKVKDVLEASGLFDSVTRTDYVISCVKDEAEVVSINIGASTIANLVKVYDANGNALTTASAYVMSLASAYCSVSKCGTAVMIMYTSSTTGNTNIQFGTIIIDSMADGGIGVSHMFWYKSDSTHVAPLPYTTSPSSAAIKGNAVSAVSSTTDSYISAYRVTTLKSDGNCADFSSTYCMRFSPTLFTARNTGSIAVITAAAVTPATISMNGKSFITDGTFLIQDA